MTDGIDLSSTPDCYIKRHVRDRYEGMWGHFTHRLTRRSIDDAIDWATEQDDPVYLAACRIAIRNRDLSMTHEQHDRLSDIELDAWQTALRVAPEQTVRYFIENETEATVLARLITREAKTGTPDEGFIERCENRIKELRSDD
jgi:hypothetical protein